MTKRPEDEVVAGHLFYNPGDLGDQAYLISAGQVEILAGTGGSATRIALMGPGDVFGEMALIEERPRNFTARAITNCRVQPITRDEFERQLVLDPAHTRAYLRSLFERLRLLSARLVGDAGKSLDAELSPAKPVELPQGTGVASEWIAVVHPLTRRAAQNLPENGLLVNRFPLRFGRAASAKEQDSLDLNDLWLMDQEPYNISRNHCELSVDAQGPLIRDRGSRLGCYVNDLRIGGREGSTFSRLDTGDNVLVIGGRMSPYQFRINISQS